MYAYIVILIILILNYTSYKNGNWFYTLREKLNKRPKVFDFFYSVLPKLELKDSTLNILNWIVFIIPFVPFFFESSGNKLDLFMEMIEYFLPVYLIRGLTTNFTILPSDKKCDIKYFTINEMIQGHCYDKLFSGHLALSMIAMYIFWKHNVISSIYLMNNILFTVFYMLLTREHYTNDLIFSFFVVYFIIKENLRIKF